MIPFPLATDVSAVKSRLPWSTKGVGGAFEGFDQLVRLAASAGGGEDWSERNVRQPNVGP
jgi:hypothetical protein